MPGLHFNSPYGHVKPPLLHVLSLKRKKSHHVAAAAAATILKAFSPRGKNVLVRQGVKYRNMFHAGSGLVRERRPGEEVTPEKGWVTDEESEQSESEASEDLAPVMEEAPVPEEVIEAAEEIMESSEEEESTIDLIHEEVTKNDLLKLELSLAEKDLPEISAPETIVVKVEDKIIEVQVIPVEEPTPEAAAPKEETPSVEIDTTIPEQITAEVTIQEPVEAITFLEDKAPDVVVFVPEQLLEPSGPEPLALTAVINISQPAQPPKPEPLALSAMMDILEPPSRSVAPLTLTAVMNVIERPSAPETIAPPATIVVIESPEPVPETLPITTDAPGPSEPEFPLSTTISTTPDLQQSNTPVEVEVLEDILLQEVQEEVVEDIKETQPAQSDVQEPTIIPSQETLEPTSDHENHEVDIESNTVVEKDPTPMVLPVIESIPSEPTLEQTIVTSEPEVTLPAETVVAAPEPVVETEIVVATPEPTAETPEPVIEMLQPVVATPEPLVTTLEAVVVTPEAVVVTPEAAEPLVTTPDEVVATPEPLVTAPDEVVATPEPSVATLEAVVATTEALVTTPELTATLPPIQPITSQPAPEPTVEVKVEPENLEDVVVEKVPSSSVQVISPQPPQETPVLAISEKHSEQLFDDEVCDYTETELNEDEDSDVEVNSKQEELEGRLESTPSDMFKLTLSLPTSTKTSTSSVALCVKPQQTLSDLQKLIQHEISHSSLESPHISFTTISTDPPDYNGNIASKHTSTSFTIKDSEHSVIRRSSCFDQSKPTSASTRWSLSTEIGAFIGDAAKAQSFTIELSPAPDKPPSTLIRVSLPTFDDRTSHMRSQLRIISPNLSSLSTLKSECDLIAQRSVQKQGILKLAISGLACLLLPLLLIAFTYLSQPGLLPSFRNPPPWELNLSHPVTTYLAAGLVDILLLAGFAYLWSAYRSTGQQNLPDLATVKQVYSKRGFDVKKWEDLQAENKRLRSEIRRVAAEYGVTWGDDEVGETKETGTAATAA